MSVHVRRLAAQQTDERHARGVGKSNR